MSSHSRSPLGRASAVVMCALLGGGMAAFACLRSEPIRDPIGVVGVPLLRGYSEATEQWSFYTFILTVILLTIGLDRLTRSLPERAIVPLGTAAPLLLSLPCWFAWPERLPLATVAAALTFAAGKFWVAPAAPRSFAAGAFALWAIGFPDVPIALCSRVEFAVATAPLMVTAAWLYPKLPPPLRGDRASGLDLFAAMLILCGASISNEQDLVLGAIGALGLFLGRWSSDRDSPASAWLWPAFNAALAAVLSFNQAWSALDPGRTALVVFGGAAGAFVLSSLLPPRVGGPVRWRRRIPALAVIALAVSNATRPWFGLLIVGSASALALGHPRPARKGLGAVALTAVLSLAILPGKPSSDLDAFHDGQVLSAVWEFEAGRALYSEVFPLRSYEFFKAWLSRKIGGPTIESYLASKQMLGSLPVAGAFLLSFAWTRSLAWSFATALGAAVYPGVGDRGGLPLLFAALGVAVFRSRRRAHLIWSILGGCAAALCGFDVLVPLAGGSVLAVLIAGPPGESGGRRVPWAGLMCLALVLPFTAFIAAWQGPRSAVAYWWLLLDNVRNLPAFYGLPLPWGDRRLASLMISWLLVVGTWASAGVLAWNRTSPGRRRAWLFLLIDFMLVAHRGLGRSDEPHLSSLILPSLALGSIGLWEAFRRLSRCGRYSPSIDRRTVAFLAMVVFSWLVPTGRVNPREFLEWLRSPPGPVELPGHSPLVAERVGEGDYLWEMEGGMLNYLHRRHNPTRHALAYCISSPAEQDVAVEALREHPPKLIAWQYQSGSDGIPNPLRFHVIARELFRRYRPIPGTSFLEPAGADWPGQVDLEPQFLGPLPLGRLPLRWGEGRAVFPGRGVVVRSSVGLGILEGSGRSWEADCRIFSREEDYLSLNITCRGRATSSTLTLEFAPTGRDFEGESRVTFTAIQDGAPHAYLLPVGCSPGWSFRPEVSRLRISSHEGTQLRAVSCEAQRLGLAR